MTRLVAIGDTHLNPGPRNAMRLRALDQIIREGRELSAFGAWIWPGDLFHSRSSIDDRNALAERMQMMATVGPILITPGNHDQNGDLDVFARLKAPWPVHVVTRPACVRVRLGTGQFATVAILPYPHKAGLVGLGIARGEHVSSAAEALDFIFMSFAGELEEARAQGDLTFFMGHANIAGSLMSSGQPAIGAEIELSASHLDRLGGILKVVNHVHRAQEIAGAVYPGSIAPMDWGETEEKRYLVCELEDSFTRRVVSKPLDVPRLYHIEGVLTRDRFDWVVKDGPDGQPLDAPASWAGCEVRVRYRFNQSEKRLLEQAKARIFAEFAEAARLELEPVAVPDRALRAPEVAAAKTLAAKVQAWAGLNNAVISDAVLAKLVALEHADATVTLSDVQRSIDTLVTPASEKTEAAA